MKNDLEKKGSVNGSFDEIVKLLCVVSQNTINQRLDRLSYTA